MSSDCTWEEGAMKARIWSALSGGESSEWESGLEIFKNGKIIGTASEGEDELHIEGDFSDYKETGKVSDDGVPEFEHHSFTLSMKDMRFITRVLKDWKSDWSLPAERWQHDKTS